MLLKELLNLVFLGDVTMQNVLRKNVIQSPGNEWFAGDSKNILAVFEDCADQVGTYKSTGSEDDNRAF